MSEPSIQVTTPRAIRLGTARQFLCFAAIGATGTALHYLVLVGLVQLSLTGPVLASAVGATLGAVVNYLLNYRITFRSQKSHWEASARFFLVALVGLGLNSAILALFLHLLPVHYLVSQLLTTGLVLIWNFLGNKLWTF
ncbi:MAG: GtrA family protein [Desulfuromonadales bacterium]|nr:GtrA family protein [Desulfuromonadales bacterium]